MERIYGGSDVPGLHPWQEAFIAAPLSPTSKAWMYSEEDHCRRTGRSLALAHMYVRLAVGSHLGGIVYVHDHVNSRESSRHVFDTVVDILKSTGLPFRCNGNHFWVRVDLPDLVSSIVPAYVHPVDRERSKAYRGL